MLKTGFMVWMATLVMAGLAVGKEGLQPVRADVQAWHLQHATVERAENSLLLSSSNESDGFALLRQTLCRQVVTVEADLLMQQRLCGSGWNLAGVTLYQDDANFWMLALVEGPDGAHTVDFIEKHGGIWQAQNQDETSLKRSGDSSFTWQKGQSYRLRLVLGNGGVRAEIADPADGRILHTATYTFENAPAVRSGRPGLIVRGSTASVSHVAIAAPAHTSAPAGVALKTGALGRLAILDDVLPGHDRAAVARLAQVLEGQGFGVTRLNAQQLSAPDVVRGGIFDLLVLPHADSVPESSVNVLRQFLMEGGHAIVIGGPLLDHALLQFGDSWLDKAAQTALLQAVVPEHRPFIIGPSFSLDSWKRSSSDSSRESTFEVVKEGPDGGDCLRLKVGDMVGWDVRQSPPLPALFGKGHTCFTFMAKGSQQTSQLAVELIERDGSRWIATVSLTPEWQRIVLRPGDFAYWRDSSVKGRGEAGDELNPSEAVRLSLGFSASHSPAVGAGKHTVWLADMGSACDPLAAAERSSGIAGESIETLYPRYKVHVMKEAVSVCTAGIGAWAPAFDSIAAGGLASDKGIVCAIPRVLGEGFGRNSRWRFMPLARATTADGKRSGVCEWLICHLQLPFDGACIAGFGYTDPAIWSSPAVLARIAATAVQLRQGILLDGGGTAQFAYWPGEAVVVGAHVRRFSGRLEQDALSIEIRRGDQVLWSKKIDLMNAGVRSEAHYEWQPPPDPAVYTVRVQLIDKRGMVIDQIEHEFAVIDPAPAPQGAFVTVKGGDFWRGGERWYPVGVNFWPLYVSGMDRADYWPGWMRDATYAPALVGRDLKQLVEMGINMISIQTPPVAESRNLVDLLRRCAAHDIRVNIHVGQASPLAMDESGLKEFLDATRIPGNATVFAYDTIWEPGNHVFKDDAARGKWDPAWREWIIEQYGSVANAEKSWSYKARRNGAGEVISPPDKNFREDGAWRGMMAAYRRFMDNLTSRLWCQASQKLRALDPNHLVSFRQGNTLPYDFALSGPVKHIDFICPEGYAIPDTDAGEDAIGFITRYVNFTTGGKPVLWSEFGKSVWDRELGTWSAAAVELQGSYSERFYRTALAAGANGTVPWWWPGGYRVDEHSDFGIVEPDRRERPAAELIRLWGPRFKQPRAKQQPDEWLTYDRDLHAGGYCYTAFHEGAAAYRAASAKGRMLGIRTQGTGSDSASVAMVAVGNVPCDGSNPPKYLDAEFNMLQILNAAGVWQDAADGAEIAVKEGQPVRARASMGNLQEATWVPPHEAGAVAGGVALIVRESGQERGRSPVGQRVPYLGDAMFSEFDLLPQLRERVQVSIRLEALGRTPFGESRRLNITPLKQ